MAILECRSQAELEAALARAKPGDIVACVGDGSFYISGSASVRASGSASVEAWDSASVEAWDSASVEAWDSASVRAWGSASVEAWDSASVRASGSASVEAWDSASVRASGSASVRASRYVSVHVDRRQPRCLVTVTGGVLIEIPPITTAAEWCEQHGIEADADGNVTLYKAVDDEWTTHNARSAGLAYTPGTTVEAPDWDPVPECGGGLHFSPRPAAARTFNPEATRFVACAVALGSLVVHHPAEYPDKVKAPRCAVIGQVDVDGEPVAAAGVAPA